MSGLDGLGWPNPEDEPKLKKTMSEPTTIDKPQEAIASDSLFGVWLPICDAPIRTTVIVGDVKNTGAGYHNGLGQWFAYGTSLPMETPTHWMPFPSPPNVKVSAPARKEGK